MNKQPAEQQRKLVLSAGIVPIHFTVDGLRVLLLRAYDYWDFPKGVVNPGEDPLVGAQRELQEEADIREVDFPWGTAFRETAPYGRGKIARYYLGRVQGPHVRILFNPLSHRIEHHEFRWVDLNEARTLVAPRVRAILDWAEHILNLR